MREIIFYRTRSGSCPVEEFLDALSGKQAQKVLWVLSLIEELETVPAEYLKKLVNTDNIWEIRANVGNDTFRVLGFFDSDRIILTNGFAKKTQKTPPQEIKLAERRKRDYFNLEEDE